jgi:AcrR family transcriptional regulator
MAADLRRPDGEGPRATGRPGPRRSDGGPAGPVEVRRAVLDAAAELFATRGLGEVGLRDIAAQANVQPSLIARYIGTRDELIDAVMNDLAERVGQDVADHPLEQLSFEPNSPLGQWTRLLASFAISGRKVAPDLGFNPSVALSHTIQDAYGLDETAARVRTAQVIALGLGWRLLESYLIDTGNLGEIPIAALRDAITETVNRIGATPWTSPAPTDDAHPRRRASTAPSADGVGPTGDGPDEMAADNRSTTMS